MWRLSDRSLSTQFLVAVAAVGLSSVASIFFVLSLVESQTSFSYRLAEEYKTLRFARVLSNSILRNQAILEHAVEGKRRAELKLKESEEALVHLENQIVDGSDVDIGDLTVSHEKFLKTTLLAEREQTNRRLREQKTAYRDSLEKVSSVVEKLHSRISKKFSTLQQDVQKFTIGVVAINIVLMLVFTFVIGELYFAVARPISNLTLGVQQFKKGKLDVQIPVTNKSEVGYLESSFNEMAEEIGQMVTRLRVLDDTKSDFLSMVSHDLRTPLTSIAGYLKLLKTGQAGDLNETQREFTEIMDQNIIRLGQLIDQLLDMEALEAGTFSISKEEFNVVHLIKEVLDRFRLAAEEKGLQLHFRSKVEKAQLRGDRSRLSQVFENLVGNAVKYTESGAVNVVVDDNDIAVTVEVSDTGKGIDESERERIFDKFYRVKRKDVAEKAGTGIGLAIVKGVVTAHGGKVIVDRGEKGGSRFVVILPKSE